MLIFWHFHYKLVICDVLSAFNPIALSLRHAKIVYNFGLSECSRVKQEEEILWSWRRSWRNRIIIKPPH